MQVMYAYLYCLYAGHVCILVLLVCRPCSLASYQRSQIYLGVEPNMAAPLKKNVVKGKPHLSIITPCMFTSRCSLVECLIPGCLTSLLLIIIIIISFTVHHQSLSTLKRGLD